MWWPLPGTLWPGGAPLEVYVASTVHWLEEQIVEARPADGLPGAEIKRRILALAEAHMAIREGGAATAFGLVLDEEARGAAAPVLPRLEAAMEEWRDFLGAAGGDKGRRMAEDLVAHFHVRLPGTPSGGSDSGAT